MSTPDQTQAGARTQAYYAKLLQAARLVEAHSHWSDSANGYLVDGPAMDDLCKAMKPRKGAR